MSVPRECDQKTLATADRVHGSLWRCRLQVDYDPVNTARESNERQDRRFLRDRVKPLQKRRERPGFDIGPVKIQLRHTQEDGLIFHCADGVHR